MIEVKNLTKTFHVSSGDIKAVDDISLSVPDSCFASIIGRSGSGKTTLLSLLGTLDKPTSGSIKVGDREVTNLSDHALVEYRCKSIGFVFQGYNLVPNLTALENIMLPLEFAGISSSERKLRASELLEQVGLDTAKQSRKPGKLSGGEQQRVAIARALANNPALILADEPIA